MPCELFGATIIALYLLVTVALYPRLIWVFTGLVRAWYPAIHDKSKRFFTNPCGDPRD